MKVKALKLRNQIWKIINVNSNLIPVYKIWPSKNRFLRNGKYMIGPVYDFGTNFCA